MSPYDMILDTTSICMWYRSSPIFLGRRPSSPKSSPIGYINISVITKYACMNIWLNNNAYVHTTTHQIITNIYLHLCNHTNNPSPIFICIYAITPIIHHHTLNQYHITITMYMDSPISFHRYNISHISSKRTYNTSC